MKKITMFLSIAFLCLITIAWFSGGVNIDKTIGKAEFSAAGETANGYQLYYDADNDSFKIVSLDSDGSGTDATVMEIEDDGKQITFTETAADFRSATVNNLGATLSNTVAVDLADGAYQYGTLTGNTNFTFTGFTAGEAAEMWLELTNAGSYELTATALDYAGGSDPSWTASGTDIVHLVSRDGGTKIHAITSLDSK
jgi:hypothetical protein